MIRNRSYRQLADTCADQAHRMAAAMGELDTILERLDSSNALALDELIAHVSRARAALHGDRLHDARG